jgi:hypothetical protein
VSQALKLPKLPRGVIVAELGSVGDTSSGLDMWCCFWGSQLDTKSVLEDGEVTRDWKGVTWTERTMGGEILT